MVHRRNIRPRAANIAYTPYSWYIQACVRPHAVGTISDKPSATDKSRINHVVGTFRAANVPRNWYISDNTRDTGTYKSL